MSLKARLRIAIVALVTLVVIGMSALYLYDFTRMMFRAASERAGLVADEVKGNLVDRLDREASCARRSTPDRCRNGKLIGLGSSAPIPASRRCSNARSLARTW